MALPNNDRQKMRAVRRLSSLTPARSLDARLQQIVDIVTDKIPPRVVRPATSSTLMERLAAGQASRSPRVGDKPAPKKDESAEADEKKRKKRGGRDRKETGGINRSADLNL